MRKHNKDIFLILGIAIISIVWACFPTRFAVITIVLALPLVFLIPGYLLLEIITQKREHDATTHFLLSIGLSLSMNILGGFVLNIIPVGLTTLTWRVFLGVVAIVGGLLCVVKRHRWQLHFGQKPKDLPTRYEFLLLTLTIYVVIFAFIYTTNTIGDQKHPGFTQFWLLLDNHQPPVCTMQLGIYSSEIVKTTYQIEVKENNQHLAHWSSITLAPRQQWQDHFPIAIKSAQTTQLRIEADLYRQQEPNRVYRTVHFFLLSSQKTCTQDLSISWRCCLLDLGLKI
jgi:uncharacterized membrane protein